MAPTKITGMVVKDIRFPTSLEKHGSDAMVRMFLFNAADYFAFHSLPIW